MPLLRLEFGDACQAIPDDSTRIATYVGGLGAARTNLQIVQRHHDVEHAFNFVAAGRKTRKVSSDYGSLSGSGSGRNEQRSTAGAASGKRWVTV